MRRATSKDKEQLLLPYRPRGGKRKGAGRKPNGKKAGVSHLERERFAKRRPVHVTLRVVDDIPTLRKQARALALRAAFCAAKDRHGLRIIHLSVQSNHIHLLVEAEDKQCLAAGMHALTIRLARALNRSLKRKGRVFADRYHGRVLKTPTETRNALCYLLNNFRRHAAKEPLRGRYLAFDWIDPFSSARYFDGWYGRAPDVDLEALEQSDPEAAQELPVTFARSWLVTKGWRRLGLLKRNAVPGK